MPSQSAGPVVGELGANAVGDVDVPVALDSRHAVGTVDLFVAIVSAQVAGLRDSQMMQSWPLGRRQLSVGVAPMPLATLAEKTLSGRIK
jgi:hypothetical protein